MSTSLDAVLISLGTGLVVLAIGMITKRVPKPVVIMIALGFGMIAFVLWPRAALVEVPDLSNLSRDEAEIRLSSIKLIGAPQHQVFANVRPEHVVPSSQNPLPGTKVRRGALVRYSISTLTSLEQTHNDVVGTLAGTSVFIFTPKDDGEVGLKRGADNIFRFDVEGTIQNFNPANSSLLIWIQPIDPPSDRPGWYLQRLPTNGVHSISGNRWRGVCQIGNQQWPPHDGNVVELAASIVPADEATSLQDRQGPITLGVIPGVVSEVTRFKVRIK